MERTINMHLHRHLARTLDQYERVSGVLGAYHTNTHHIPIQYIRRFLNSKSYAPVYWSSEIVSEYLPVLKHCVYQKGSLMQT